MGRKHDAEDRTEDAFTAIKKLWKEKGTSPSLREIGKEMEIKSSSLISFYVDKLEKAGKIKRNKTRDILLVKPKEKIPIRSLGRDNKILSIPDFGNIAAGIPLLLPDASFSKANKGDIHRTVVDIPESYLPEGIKADDVFALHVEGDSMRNAMLTEGDIVILQKTSVDQVKDNDIVAAWIIDDQETTLKRIEFSKKKRGIWLKPENPTYKPHFFLSTEVDIQGKLLAVLRFRY
jgi:repressor LexA